MKALTVKNPWAAFLVSGDKTIELRSWQTPHRGDLLICSSAAEKNMWVAEGAGDPEAILLPAGAMLGVVKLLGCRLATKEDADAALCDVPKGSYAWMIDASHAYETRPDKVIGRLRLFEVPDERIRKLAPDDDWHNYPPPQGKRKLSERSIVI